MEKLDYLNQQLVETTQKLVRIPSWVKEGEESEHNENKVVDFMEAWMRENTTLTTLRQPLANGRFNLIAHKGDPDLVFLGHTDTVAPAADAQYDQLAAEIHDGKIWGRGTSDMKSGLAAIMHALSASPEANNVWFMAYADEEYNFEGMQGLVKNYGDIRPKMLVSADGSDLKLGLGCRGLIDVRLRARGQSGHAARGNGVNAIDGVMRAIDHLRSEFHSKQKESKARTSLNTAYMLGGGKLPNGISLTGDRLVQVSQEGNVIPDIAEVVVDIRPATPEINADSVAKRLSEIGDQNGIKINLVNVRHNLGAWRTDPNEVTSAINVLEAVTGEPVIFDDPNASGYLDLQMLWAATGKPPAIMFGGGNGESQHKPTEHIAISNLIAMKNYFQALLELHIKNGK